MKSVLPLLASMTIILFTNELTGRWETKPSEKGNITGVVFKTDSTYEGYINKKPFVSGKYVFRDGIISIKENGCDSKGVYRIIFFSNGDSLRFEPVNDSCQERKEGMTRIILGRVK